MRFVYLLRHAKSSWKSGLPDHERPLAPRGRRAAKAICMHMREQGIEPELVLCSTAQRTRETLERIELALGSADVRIEDELYGAGEADLLHRLRGVQDTIGSVMLIGHNPGLELLALELAQPAPGRRALEEKFPTGALATLVFPDASWHELGPGAAELAGFVRPRDLES